MTGEEDRSVITQPEAVPLIHVPMLEPSEASQKVWNTRTFKGAHAPACGVSCDTLSSVDLLIRVMPDLSGGNLCFHPRPLSRLPPVWKWNSAAWISRYGPRR